MAQQPPPPGTPDPSGDGHRTPVPLPPRYRFAAPLGEGGIGTVVKAYDTQLRTHVAIKTIRHDLATRNPLQYAHLRDRFEREAIAGARVRSSPYIVTVHDLVIDHANNAFLILEYIPGGTLADRLHPDGTRTAVVPLAVAEALRLTADAARGLQDLHDADLVHRDIKPENIFIAANGWAKVGDLGIVQMSTTTFRTRMEYGSDRGHPGTPMYMSPEQANTGDVLTPEADQYSLGCVLFEVVTGKRFKGIHAPECERLLRGQPVGVAGLIRQMTATEAAERYEGMGAVLAAIAAIDLTVPPEPVAPDPRLAPVVTIPAITVPGPLVDRHETRRVDPQPATPVRERRPPPAAPTPARPISRRAVLAGIGGVVVAGGAADLWAVRQAGDGGTPPVPTATAAAVATPASTPVPATPSPVPATATPTPATPTATPVSPTATTIPQATATRSAGPTALTSWMDATGLVRLGYPSAWKLEVGGNKELTIFQPAVFSGTAESGQMTVRIFAAADLDDAVKNESVHVTSPNTLGTTLTVNGPTVSTNVAGESARAFAFTYAGTLGRDWVVFRKSKLMGVAFEGFRIDKWQNIYDDMIASVTFLQ